MTEKLPDNLEEALKFIREQQAKISHLQAENTEQKNEITELKATVDKQNIMLSNLNEMLVKGRKAMFGKSSEQLSNIEGSEQLTLFNEAEQEYSAASPEPTAETITQRSVSTAASGYIISTGALRGAGFPPAPLKTKQQNIYPSPYIINK